MPKKRLNPCVICGHTKEAHEKKGPCRVGHEATGDLSAPVEFAGKVGTRAEWRASLGLPAPCECPGYVRKGSKMATKKVTTTNITIDGTRARAVLEAMSDAFAREARACDELAHCVDDLLELLGPKLPKSLEPVKNPLTPAGIFRVEKKLQGALEEAFAKVTPITSHFETSRDEPARRVYEDGSTRELAAGVLAAGPRALLTTIAQYGGKATRDALHVVTGYRSTSIRVYLGELTGLIERDGPHGNATRFKVTQAGLAELGAVPPKATVDELLEAWTSKRLGDGPAAILSLVAAQGTVDKRTIESQSGYKATSVRVYVGELVRNKLVRNERGMVRLSPWLGGPS